MKRFIITIVCAVGIPLVILMGLYWWTDPFRCLHPFDINNTDATNREYLSTELFLHNKDSIHYDSYIFASSKGGGLNTYQWKQYLGGDAQPFLFQAWGETLTGEYLKLKYLDESGLSIRNAIVLLDIPGSFINEQLPHKALSMKHFLFTDGTRWGYNAVQFFNYIQKPGIWVNSIINRNKREAYCADPITNDWNRSNSYDYCDIPEQDSLKQCSPNTRNSLFERIRGRSIDDISVSSPLIGKDMEMMLCEMKAIFEKHHTNYVVILSPAICFENPSVNPDDLTILRRIFGVDNVYDYTGVNPYTTDVNDYSDPGHFGRRVGWLILRDIYEK